MMNHVIIIGKFIHLLEEDDVMITVSVPRILEEESLKYDDIKCKITKTISSYLKESCKINDLVGIKGRLQVIDGETVIVADKVTFLSNNSR